jgi:hypothetical protein
MLDQEDDSLSQSVTLAQSSMDHTQAVCWGPAWSEEYVAVSCTEVAGADGGTWDVKVVLVHVKDQTVQWLSYGEQVSSQFSVALTFSKDGNSLAVAGAGHVGLWERENAGEWAFRMVGNVGKVTLAAMLSWTLLCEADRS